MAGEGPKRPYTENRAAANKRWTKRNQVWLAEYGRKYALKYPAKYLCRVARHRAKKRGIIFTITESDVVVPSHCPVLGMKLEIGVGISTKPGGNPNSPSLDRINPTLGYVPGNVRVISHMANSMKGAADSEQLRRFAQWVLDHV